MRAYLTATAPRPRRGFSLVEVILALGIMAVAIVSILGLIGKTLTAVRLADEISSGTGCIDKMNSLIQNSPFWDDGPDGSGESVYNWVVKSTSNSPTVFIFYNEVPDSTSSITGDSPLQRVVRFNTAFNAISKVAANYAMNQQKDVSIPQIPIYQSLDDFVTAVTSGRIDGPVIAMTLSASPLMKNFPKAGPDGDETRYYGPPTNDSIFPNAVNMTTDPTGQSGSHVLFPEAYLPIYVQAFIVSLTNIQPGEDANTLSQSLVDNLTQGNRLFTYTTARLR